jgi:hypothetical protein
MDRIGDDELDPATRRAAGLPDAPPKVPLALALGVTGHRPDLIGDRRASGSRRGSPICSTM